MPLCFLSATRAYLPMTAFPKLWHLCYLTCILGTLLCALADEEQDLSLNLLDNNVTFVLPRSAVAMYEWHSAVGLTKGNSLLSPSDFMATIALLSIGDPEDVGWQVQKNLFRNLTPQEVLGGLDFEKRQHVRFQSQTEFDVQLAEGVDTQRYDKIFPDGAMSSIKSATRGVTPGIFTDRKFHAAFAGEFTCPGKTLFYSYQNDKGNVPLQVEYMQAYFWRNKGFRYFFYQPLETLGFFGTISAVWNSVSRHEFFELRGTKCLVMKLPVGDGISMYIFMPAKGEHFADYRRLWTKYPRVIEALIHEAGKKSVKENMREGKYGVYMPYIDFSESADVAGGLESIGVNTSKRRGGSMFGQHCSMKLSGQVYWPPSNFRRYWNVNKFVEVNRPFFFQVRRRVTKRRADDVVLLMGHIEDAHFLG